MKMPFEAGGILKAPVLYVGLTGDRKQQYTSSEHAIICRETPESCFIGTAMSLLPCKDAPRGFCLSVSFP